MGDETKEVESPEKNLESNEDETPQLNEQAKGTKIAEEMNIGDYVKFGKYYNEPILWGVVDKNDGVMLVSERVLCLKPFDAAESGSWDNEGGHYTTDEDRQRYGSNEWINSNIREWLNSSEQKVAYTTQPPTKSAIWDGDNAYDKEPGFLSNFTQDERNAIKPIVHDTLIDKVYLLSEDELDKISEKTRKPTAIAVRNSSYKEEGFLAHDKNWWYWLRTPDPDDSYSVIGVDYQVGLDTDYASSGDPGVLPALNLNSDVFISDGEGTERRPYVVIGLSKST